MSGLSYLEYLDRKKVKILPSGFDVDENDLNKKLFPFQRFIVKRALSRGKYAVWADCGLGKTAIQLEWANRVSIKTGRPVLIFTPLAVSIQTINEGVKFGIEVSRYGSGNIQVINYDQIENIDPSLFSGVVLDESSILKNFDGATKKKLIDLFEYTEYKLCCTATPSPNDVEELGNHSEFLNVMKRSEMLAMFFLHDGGDTGKWRLKPHGHKHFWRFVSQWAIMLCKPSDIGFEMQGYDLPSLNFFERKIKTEKRENGKIFNDVAVSATTFNQELRLTKIQRLTQAVEIVNASDESFIIWIKHDEEGEYLQNLIPDAVEVSGSDSLERKEFVSLWFGDQKNECQCQNVNTKEEKSSTSLNIGLSTTLNTKKKLVEKQISGFPKEERLTRNIEDNELSITDGIIETTSLNSIYELQNRQQIGIKKGEIDTPKIQNIESDKNSILKKPVKKETIELIIPSEKNMGSHSRSTNQYSKGKNQDAPYVEQNQPSLKSNKDCTSTIVTKQEKLEDCSVQNAISDSDRLMIQKYCSNVPLCTCCGKHKRKLLISKLKILSYGVNYQNCHNQIFASLDFSFEGLYQGIRRSYRFGQEHPVNIWIITTDTMTNVMESVNKKQSQFLKMQQEMNANMNEELHFNKKGYIASRSTEMKLPLWILESTALKTQLTENYTLD
jgi:hypothetical protein